MSKIIAGRNNVLAALQGGGSLTKIYIAENIRGDLKQMLNLAKGKGCPVQFVPRKKLDSLADGLNHQGMLAEVAAWQYADFNQLIADLDIDSNPIVLVLDGVEDPHNLGALLRSSECAGVAGIIIPKRRSAQLTETVARVSMGAIESVKVARVGNLAQTLEKLKEAGFWVAAADKDGDNYWTVDWNFPVALVLGGEGKGVSRLIRQRSDHVVSIPVHGQVDSLNVSVAGGVLLYEILRQRVDHGISNN